ncbi:MAG: hypothetical protein ACRELT_10280 [Longimicrobiales bacterium]
MRPYSKHVALFLTVSAVAACGTDGVLDPSQRPEPPPADALFADFSFFEERTPEPGGETTSWAQALQTVASAEADMAVLAIPEAMVRVANATQGTREGNAWTWPFGTSVDGTGYVGELRAVVAGSRYEWDLLVTSPGHSPPLSNYLWGKAATLPNGFEGRWLLANAAEGSDSIVAAVQWIRNAEGGINFGFSASDSAGWTYERSVNAVVLTHVVFDAVRARVTWFLDSGTGRSTTSATSPACWNADLHDVAC